MFVERSNFYKPQRPLAKTGFMTYELQQDTVSIYNKNIISNEFQVEEFTIPPMPGPYKSLTILKAFSPELERAIYFVGERIVYLHKTFPQYNWLKDREKMDTRSN